MHQTYNVAAFGLCLVACLVLYLLARRRSHVFLTTWMMLWLLLTGHTGLVVLSGLLDSRVVQAAAAGLLVLAAIYLSGVSYGSPTTADFRRWHKVALAGAVAWAFVQTAGWPRELSLLPLTLFTAFLFGHAGIRMWMRRGTHDIMSQRLMSVAVLLLIGAPTADFAVALSAPQVLVPAEIGRLYGLLVLAVSMIFMLFEASQRGVEENLLGLSGLNLATSSYPATENLEDLLAKVLERTLKLAGLSQGLITLEGTAGRPGMHLFLGFPGTVTAEWEETGLDHSVTALVSRMGGLVILRDLQETSRAGRLDSDAEFRGLSAVMKHAGVRALMALSLQTKSGLYGALLLAHPQNRALSATELKVIATLASQIAMSVENFLLMQGSHRRAEELRLLNQTGQAMSSTLNPDALFRLVHQEIQKLLDARNFYIAIADEAAGEVRFELEVEDGAYLPKRARKAGPGLTEYVLRTKEPLLLKSAVDEFRAANGIAPSGRVARSWLGVPLLLYERALGVMAVQNFDRENAFDDGHLDIMKTLAAQTAIALENARLFSDEKRRLRQLSFLHNISRIAISTLNSEQMLAEIAREIQKNFAYDHIGIGLLDYQSKEIEIKAEAGQQAQPLGRRIALDSGIVGRVARSREMMVVNDTLAGAGKDAEERRAVLPNARSVLCVPIVYADQVLGVLNVESTQPQAFQQETVLILRTLADHLSTALHNAFVFQRTQQQAMTDGLTGVKTHRFFMEAVQSEWKRAIRAGRIFSIIVLDLDRFKQVNDTMGHLEGDLVLSRLGKLLEQRCRQSNVVARYGGDEFMILVPEGSTEQAQILAERLRLWIATDSVFAERKLTGSFGVATYPTHGDSPEELIRAADAGLYLSKHQGGNSVTVAEQFRRQANAASGWRNHVLYTYLETLARRLETTGPETLDSLLRRLEEAWPAFPGDPAELERAVLEGMALVAEALDRRISNGRAHMQQVTRYAMMLASELQMSERELDELQVAARIHDVGYIAVPAGLLSKAGRLAPAEFAAVQSHSGAGARLLETLRVNANIVAMIRHHHEFYNGSGYPDGLAADDIPLGARILSVSDAYDAITSERPHRRARSGPEAVEELERFSGTQFDPQMVRAFIRALRAEAGAVESVSTGG